MISAHLNFGPVAYLANRLFDIPYTLSAYGIDVHEGLSTSRRNALRNADNVIAAKKAGVNNYIVKPFNAATLKSKIDAVFEDVSVADKAAATANTLLPA